MKRRDCMKGRDCQKLNIGKNCYGGIAIEYIIVTSFALISGAAAVGYLSKIVKQKLAHLDAALEQEEAEADSLNDLDESED